MVARACSSAAGSVGDPDVDVARGLRQLGRADLHRQPDLAGLILPDLDDGLAVSSNLDAGDANCRARQAGDLERKRPLLALVEDAQGVVVADAATGELNEEWIALV